MDKLGLESPKTIEDAETIVRAFIEKDPGEMEKARQLVLYVIRSYRVSAATAASI